MESKIYYYFHDSLYFFRTQESLCLLHILCSFIKCVRFIKNKGYLDKQKDVYAQTHIFFKILVPRTLLQVDIALHEAQAKLFS